MQLTARLFQRLQQFQLIASRGGGGGHIGLTDYGHHLRAQFHPAFRYGHGIREEGGEGALTVPADDWRLACTAGGVHAVASSLLRSYSSMPQARAKQHQRKRRV
ncbi:hypothetical protein D3C85_1661710 [compost metagenome]